MPLLLFFLFSSLGTYPEFLIRQRKAAANPAEVAAKAGLLSSLFFGFFVYFYFFLFLPLLSLRGGGGGAGGERVVYCVFPPFI